MRCSLGQMEWSRAHHQRVQELNALNRVAEVHTG